MDTVKEMGVVKIDDRHREDMYGIVDFDVFYKALGKEGAVLLDEWREEIPFTRENIYPCTSTGGFYVATHGPYSLEDIVNNEGKIKECHDASSDKEIVRWAMY